MGGRATQTSRGWEPRGETFHPPFERNGGLKKAHLYIQCMRRFNIEINKAGKSAHSITQPGCTAKVCNKLCSSVFPALTILTS